MRWAPAFAFLAYLAAALIWLGRDPALRRTAYDSGSSLGTGDDGASLARGYLAQRGGRASALLRPLAGEGLPRDAVVFRLDPQHRAAIEPREEAGGEPGISDSGISDSGISDAGISDAGISFGTLGRRGARSQVADRAHAGPAASTVLTSDEDDFVRAGGRLVLAIPGELIPDGAAARKTAPALAGVSRLSPAAPRALPAAALVDATPVFEHGEAPSVAVRSLGKGDVWFFSEPDLFLNARLGEADHLMALIALAAGRPVLFDEAAHGLRDDSGILGLLRRWGFGPALLFAALALGAAFWRAAATVGPPDDGFRDLRSEAVELVDSMAALYRRSLSPAEALQLYRGRLVHEIALRRGVSERRAEALLPELAPGLDLPARGERFTSAAFRAQLSILVHAFQRSRDEHRRR